MNIEYTYLLFIIYFYKTMESKHNTLILNVLVDVAQISLKEVSTVPMSEAYNQLVKTLLQM